MNTDLVSVHSCVGQTSFYVSMAWLGVSTVYISPEAVTSKFWRAAFSGPLKASISLIVIDEAHLIQEWGSDFRPAFKELSFLPSAVAAPVMLLSATAPLSLVSWITSHLHLNGDCSLISGPLDRPNLFYSINASKSLCSVFYLLSCVLSSATTLEDVPKTLIFCTSKDTLYNVYSHLVRSCNGITKGTVGQYHATMTDAGRTQHYEYFKNGKEKVMVATSAFGLGVDIPDIKEVLIYGTPHTGSEFAQLSGRGGRDPSMTCFVNLVVRDKDVTDCDQGMKKLVAAKSCLRKTIVKDILESDEIIEDHNLCCSFCISTIRPRAFVPTFAPPRPLPRAIGPIRTKRVHAGQRENLRQALVCFRQTSCDSGSRMRGLEATLATGMIEKIIKDCRSLCTEQDVQLLGVDKEVSHKVFSIIELCIPRTTSSCPTLNQTTASRPVRQASARHVLADICNLGSIV